MTRYVISLFVGMLIGVGAFLALIYFNPLTSRNELSPLSVSSNEIVILKYSAVAGESLAYTNDGVSQVKPYPARILQLWEGPIHQTVARAAVLSNARGQAVGLGIKFSSDSESTNILNGQAMVDSVWHVYLPGRGSMFIEQRENYWNYLRDIVLPAYWSSADSWRGSWQGNITAGPGALGLGRVVGGSGEFAGLHSAAVESLSAKAYSIGSGPVALDGEIAVEIRAMEAEATPIP